MALSSVVRDVNYWWILFFWHFCCAITIDGSGQNLYYLCLLTPLRMVFENKTYGPC